MLSIQKIFNFNNLQKDGLFKDLFDIKSFVIVFTIFSLISIWSSDLVYNKTKKIKYLNKELEKLKAEYVSTKTILMSKSKKSVLLQKGSQFGLSESKNPVKIMYLEYEN